MNILFVMNHYPDSRNGGIENVTRMLSRQFKEKGIGVNIRYLYNSKFDHSDDSIFTSCQYVEVNELETEIGDSVAKYNIDVIINRCVIFATPILRQAIKGTDCQLVTTYNNKPTLDPPTLKEVFANKDVSLIKKIAISLTFPLFCKRSINRLRARHQKNYELSDHTVLLSGRYVPEYAELMKIGKEKLVVLNNPIKNGFSISLDEIAKKNKTILMVTRLDETQKCVVKALKVWQRISTAHGDWKLLIIGSGPDEDVIKGFAQVHDIKNVEFKSACNPEEYYRISSIFLMTSRNEGWPNTINEAMRMGCVPVVIATFSAVYDMIDRHKNGVIIEPKNDESEIEDCVNEISRIINDASYRNRMSRDAISKTERLSIDNIAPQWIQLFERKN